MHNQRFVSGRAKFQSKEDNELQLQRLISNEAAKSWLSKDLGGHALLSTEVHYNKRRTLVDTGATGQLSSIKTEVMKSGECLSNRLGNEVDSKRLMDTERYKKELPEKRAKQQFLMKSELDRQVEEKRRRGLMEMQKKKEEEEKEEQRIKREQQELANIYKQEEHNKGKVYNHIKRMNNNYVGYSKKPDVSSVNKHVVPKKVIEDYQKELELLANERQLDKEKALLYREQIMIERERQLQLMMERMAMNKHSKFNQPVVRPESKETCEESSESFIPRIPTRDDNNLIDPTKRVEVMEKSLASDTKFVAISPEYMDKTWKQLEEKSVQTTEQHKNNATTKNEVIEEESIFLI
jgi:hypothetical protein